MTAAVNTVSYNPMELQLPWASSEEQDKKFRKLLTRLLIVLLLLFLIVPWLPLPEVSREEAEALPPQLAKVILETPEEVIPVEPEPVVEEVVPEETVQESVEQPDVVEPEPKPVVEAPKPESADVQAARDKVSSIGVNAAASQLSSLRSSLNLSALQVKNDNVSSGGSEKTERSVLSSDNATATSGGLTSGDVSTDVGAAELAGKSSEAVDGNIDLGGGGATASGDSDGQYAANKLSGRDMESIRRVFEAEKGAIYSLYSRALRSDPNLQGKFVFELIIKPDGSVTDVKLVESELGDDRLERRILSRIRLIRFEPADVADTPVNYKFDFLPG